MYQYFQCINKLIGCEDSLEKERKRKKQKTKETGFSIRKTLRISWMKKLNVLNSLLKLKLIT